MQACALHNCSKALKLACSLAGPRDFLPLRTFTKAQRLRRWEHAFLSAPVSTYRPWKPVTRPCDWLISRSKRFPLRGRGEQSLCSFILTRKTFSPSSVLYTRVILDCKKKEQFLSFHARSVCFRGGSEVGHVFLNFRLHSCEFDSVWMIYGTSGLVIRFIQLSDFQLFRRSRFHGFVTFNITIIPIFI